MSAREPLLGYRSWQLITPGYHKDRSALEKLSNRTRSYVADPRLDEWMKQRQPDRADRGEIWPLSVSSHVFTTPGLRPRTPWCPGTVTFFCPHGMERPGDCWDDRIMQKRYGKRNIRHACGCGLWAWGTLSAAKAYGHRGVHGAIVAWGRIIEYDEEPGFRAQHARVVALAMPRGQLRRQLATRVAERFGVPLVRERDLERVAREFGKPMDVLLRIGRRGGGAKHDLAGRSFRDGSDEQSTRPQHP